MPPYKNLKIVLTNLGEHCKVRTAFETTYFYDFLLDVPIRSYTLEQSKWQLEQIICN